ncbi:MAG: hypothetical protein D6762_07415 [Candidatus Neomarinimicrobiota bacterium]|nr:MAG: hypothetical protein D6762_07415 [Candidatus Neomarinimicrobiota bacterium]
MSTLVPWKPVQKIDPVRLVQVRKQTHWATQIVSAVADACLDHQTDDSHTNLGWRADLEALVGRKMPQGYQLGLRIPSLNIILLDSFGKEIAALPLSGKTIEEAFHWIRGTVERLLQQKMEKTPAVREYELPDHPVGTGAPFDRSDPEALQQLANWFHNGFSLLNALVEWEEDTTEVRCWPHHFDIGVLLSMGVPYDFSTSIGMGLSPGDGTYEEPYWYVNPYPRPQPEPKQKLPSGGFWHREGWFGAVLRGSKIWNRSDQEERVRAFLSRALEIEKALY